MAPVPHLPETKEGLPDRATAMVMVARLATPGLLVDLRKVGGLDRIVIAEEGRESRAPMLCECLHQDFVERLRLDLGDRRAQHPQRLGAVARAERAAHAPAAARLIMACAHTKAG